VGYGRGGIHRAGADHNRNSSSYQTLDTFHALCISQEGPISHRAAINDAGHARRNKLLPLLHKGVAIWGTIGFAGGHQSGKYPGENARFHVLTFLS
jgi:hypothetical protein